MEALILENISIVSALSLLLSLHYLNLVQSTVKLATFRYLRAEMSGDWISAYGLSGVLSQLNS
jgi:hypothetical protein